MSPEKNLNSFFLPLFCSNLFRLSIRAKPPHSFTFKSSKGNEECFGQSFRQCFRLCFCQGWGWFPSLTQPYGALRSSPMEPYGALRRPMEPCAALRSPKEFDGALWSPTESCGALQSPTEPYGALRNPTEAFGTPALKVAFHTPALEVAFHPSISTFNPRPSSQPYAQPCPPPW